MISGTACLFTLSANKKLAADIAKELGIELTPCSVFHFADGETLCEPLESVRGKNCYIVQSTSKPVNENLIELLVFIDALKRASARTITAIIPYYGYARQDRKAKPRQPITSKLVADLLKTAGATRVICVDLHTSQIQGYFSCLMDEVTAIPLLANHFMKKVKEGNWTVVSPDHGGVNRARLVAEILNTPLAIIDKRRKKPNEAEVMNIIGEVKDKHCLLIDDIIDTAGSCSEGAKALKKAGATSVHIAASHGIFSNPACDRLFNNDIFEEVVITDSIERAEPIDSPKLTTLSLAPILSQIITHIEKDIPISSVYDIYKY